MPGVMSLVAHSPFPDLGGDFIDAEAGAWGKGQSAVDYTGGTAVRTGLLLTDGQVAS